VYQKLIVGYRETDEGSDALALGRMLAAATGAQTVITSVLHGPLAGQAHEAMEVVQAAAASAGLDSVTKAEVLQDRSPARALHDLAEREHAEVIVLGSTHRGPLGRVFPGSVAERLLTGAPCAVAVAPRGYAREAAHGPPRVLEVGFDGFPQSWNALAHAQLLAGTCAAALRLIAVAEADAVFGSADPAMEGAVGVVSERRRLEQDLSTALEMLPTGLRPLGTVLPGRAAEVLAGEAEKGVDLLVVGSRGYGPMRRAMVGGVASELMRTSPCPVLIVPRSATLDVVEPAPGVPSASAQT
jgi:nucleotide-binding universal stress UspA family protein